jgi:ferredoxin
VEALSLVSANDPHRPRRRLARLDERRCLGCGVCVLACRHGNIVLEPRAERVITPLDSVHRTVVMAIERGTLHHLLFDDRSRWSHRALAAVLGVVLRLPPVQRTLARQQLGSRYLEALIERYQASRGRPSPA